MSFGFEIVEQSWNLTAKPSAEAFAALKTLTLRSVVGRRSLTGLSLQLLRAPAGPSRIPKPCSQRLTSRESIKYLQNALRESVDGRFDVKILDVMLKEAYLVSQ
jgi:hypothetical protein